MIRKEEKNSREIFLFLLGKFCCLLRFDYYTFIHCLFFLFYSGSSWVWLLCLLLQWWCLLIHFNCMGGPVEWGWMEDLEGRLWGEVQDHSSPPQIVSRLWPWNCIQSKLIYLYQAKFYNLITNFSQSDFRCQHNGVFTKPLKSQNRPTKNTECPMNIKISIWNESESSNLNTR